MRLAYVGDFAIVLLFNYSVIAAADAGRRIIWRAVFTVLSEAALLVLAISARDVVRIALAAGVAFASLPLMVGVVMDRLGERR